MRAIVTSRLDSLQGTFQARVAILEAQRDAVADPKIQRMRQAQIQRATDEHRRRIDEMQEACNRADITTEHLVTGVLTVTPE